MPYFLALFERIPGSSEDTCDLLPELDAHIREITANGQLVLGGTLPGDPSGVGILEAESLDAAESIVRQNPTVGRTADVHLMEIANPVGRLAHRHS